MNFVAPIAVISLRSLNQEADCCAWIVESSDGKCDPLSFSYTFARLFGSLDFNRAFLDSPPRLEN